MWARNSVQPTRSNYELLGEEIVLTTPPTGEALKPVNDEGEFESLQRQIDETQIALDQAVGEEMHAKVDLDRAEQMQRKNKVPYETRMDQAVKQRQGLEEEMSSLQEKLNALTKEHMPYDLGPAYFDFVEGVVFDTLSNLVVTCNLTQMALQASGRYTSYNTFFGVLEQVFLSWYVFEVSSKIIFLRRNFFVGKLSVVWWHYLDFLIAVSGVLDQWFAFIFHGLVSHSVVKMLRIFRVFRILRILKLVRAFFKSDLGWTEEPEFITAMTLVIAVNSVVMALELDYDWPGWVVVENIFLILYTFELVAKLKHQGCNFFTHSQDIVWNQLDFLIVSSAILDQWLLPLLSLIALFLGMEHGLDLHNVGTVTKFLRLTRLLRVLRLARLLKRIKPLYLLLFGVLEAMEAMKWVMILTALLLYACSIVFTTLVGKGLIFGGKTDMLADAAEFYGSVPTSFFSLFKMMNGDTEPLEPIATVPLGKVLFVIFMIVANWAILAILTSVVSDNMISASSREMEREREEENYRLEVNRHERIQQLFKKIDHNHNGVISGEEWESMLADEDTRAELEDASGLEKEFLHDLFVSLRDEEVDKSGCTFTSLSHNTFCKHMKDESKVANQRSIMAIMAHIKALDSKMDAISARLEISNSRKSRRESKALALPTNSSLQQSDSQCCFPFLKPRVS